jgi:hypothetical protein
MVGETRGGMSKNSFGGRKRLDHLDLMKFRLPNSTPEQMLYLATIQDAAHNYLFYGLGRNGTSLEEFWSSYRYFFIIKRKDIAKELKPYAFDSHYEESGLSQYLTIDNFVSYLKNTRRAILRENKEQVKTYIATVQRKLRREARLTGPIVTDKKLFNTLTVPTVRSLSNLIYFTTPNEVHSDVGKVTSP